MAITITKGPNSVSLSVMSEDWVWTTTYPGHTAGIIIAAIVCIPGGTDTFIIRDGGITGPIILKEQLTAPKVYSFGWGVIMAPAIDYSELTLNAGHNICFLRGRAV